MAMAGSCTSKSDGGYDFLFSNVKEYINSAGQFASTHRVSQRFALWLRHSM